MSIDLIGLVFRAFVYTDFLYGISGPEFPRGVFSVVSSWGQVSSNNNKKTLGCRMQSISLASVQAKSHSLPSISTATLKAIAGRITCQHSSPPLVRHVPRSSLAAYYFIISSSSIRSSTTGTSTDWPCGAAWLASVSSVVEAHAHSLTQIWSRADFSAEHQQHTGTCKPATANFCFLPSDFSLCLSVSLVLTFSLRLFSTGSIASHRTASQRRKRASIL